MAAKGHRRRRLLASKPYTVISVVDGPQRFAILEGRRRSAADTLDMPLGTSCVCNCLRKSACVQRAPCINRADLLQRCTQQRFYNSSNTNP